MSKTRTCLGLVISATKWLPVLLTCTIFTWGWYAYTFQVVLFSMNSMVQQIICLVIFHILFVFAFWSYLQTIFGSTGRIPSNFEIPPEVSEDLAKASTHEQREEILSYLVKKNDLPVSCRTYNGGIRYCEKCNIIKPDRCHHCSICGACILKMDHHCPWINNCVSFNNYKFFVLFLGYTFALCVFTGATTFPYFLKFWNLADMKPVNNGTTTMTTADNNMTTLEQPTNTDTNPHEIQSIVPFGVKFHILFLFFVTTMLAMGVMCLFIYHIHLLLQNRSTLEAFRPPLMTYGPDRNAFNLGKKENCNQLFGRNKLLWLVPIFTTEGSGYSYDQRPNMESLALV